MLSMVMMALGGFRFGMGGDSYQQFARTAAYRWEKVNRIGRAPALQFTGPDAEELRLEGVIYPHFKGGLRQVEMMRLQAKVAKPMMMVDGLGWVWDRWVITHVEERKSVFLADGAPRKIEFSLTLHAYGQDNGVLSSFLGGL
ncbi:phage tail protein [Phaeobacter inhibens]|uniref:phage tail protein n=1 Tax=Phaeobacter inhibens TaxID=221822 RepID=UPI00076BB848|nr:phage tail protein [Phaeobacter inhibens]KXF90520.1 phage tail protein [Phaeobacter inhibens]WHP66802.1 phage tail protein [Phaeobacter inhibens]